MRTATLVTGLLHDGLSRLPDRRSSRQYLVRALRAAGAVALMTACQESVAPSGFTPGAVDPDSGNWVVVGVGDETSCALDADGRVFCWGMNESGRLGTRATTVSVAAPSVVQGPIPRFVKLSVGGSHQCALTADGAAYCWGANSYGQLGTGGGTGDVTMPTAVVGEIRFRSITAGFNFTCAISMDDRGYCWGDHSMGQLGIGPNSACDANGDRCSFPSPMPVASDLRFSQLSAGFWHACGITADGTAYCWGDNREGELGNQAVPPECVPATDRVTCTAPAPVMVSSDAKFTQLSAGMLYSCGVAVGGAAYCWGAISADPAVGASHLGNSSYSGYYGASRGSGLPVPVDGGLRFREISTGHDSTCGLTVDGMAVCWGSNNFGQLGFATMAPSYTTTPRAVHMPSAPHAPARGLADHACALTTRGRIWCWGGFNFFGALGSPPVSPPGIGAQIRPTPAPVDAAQ